MLTTEHPGGLKAETLDSGMIRLERNDVVLVIEPGVRRLRRSSRHQGCQAAVAQLVEAPESRSGQCGFESRERYMRKAPSDSL